MAMIPVVEDLDRCKIALQWVAEMQSDSLTAVLEILLERLDATIGQVHAQLHQCTCQAHAPLPATSVPAPPGILTVLPGRRQMPRPAALEELPTGDALQEPLDQEA